MGPQEPGLVSGDLCVCALHGTTEQETNCAGDIVSQVSKTMRIQGGARGTRAAGAMREREAGGCRGVSRCLRSRPRRFGVRDLGQLEGLRPEAAVVTWLCLIL